MGKKRDLGLMEEQAVQLEQKAREVRQELARLRREETERQNLLAGQTMRRLWAQWEWATIEDVEVALTEAFGPPAAPRGRRKTAAFADPNSAGSSKGEGDPEGDPADGEPARSGVRTEAIR